MSVKSLAVALSYEAPHAPTVVAMGRGVIGEKIIAAAKAHDIPLQENPALAEALSSVELDDEIPEALYLAVAQIIGFLMRPGRVR
jgi:flagellar biosynthesis protein